MKDDNTKYLKSMDQSLKSIDKELKKANKRQERDNTELREPARVPSDELKG